MGDGSRDHPKDQPSSRETPRDPAAIQPRLAREVPYMTCWLASSLAKAARYRTLVMQRMKSWARSLRVVDEPEEPRSMQRLGRQGKKLYVSFVSHSYVTGLILCVFHQAASKNRVAGRAYQALDLPWGISSSVWSFSPGLPTNRPCALCHGVGFGWINLSLIP